MPIFLQAVHGLDYALSRKAFRLQILQIQSEPGLARSGMSEQRLEKVCTVGRIGSQDRF